MSSRPVWNRTHLLGSWFNLEIYLVRRRNSLEIDVSAENEDSGDCGGKIPPWEILDIKQGEHLETLFSKGLGMFLFLCP